MNIYVGNLAPTVNEKDLETEFAKYGSVSSVKIIRDMFTQQSKGFGFIEMPSTAEAQNAIKELNTHELQGKRIIVNEARPQTRKGKGGRRNGGGGGGGRGRRY